MKSIKEISLTALLSATLMACASSSEDITASYVSPMKYNSYSCGQMEQEYARLLQESSITNERQDDIAGNDTVAMGVGMVLFWPALFFIDNDDHKEEVARLKGEIKAVEQTSIQKDCYALSQTIAADRAALAEEMKKRKEAQQNDTRQL